MRVSNLKQWFKLALVLLVSACPCALVLSTPVATFCALLKAARTGLLIKGGDVLEAMARIKVVAFDKTGTITKGEFTVIEFQSISRNLDLQTILYWVSSIESKSSHPTASAIVGHARSMSIQPKPDNVREFRIYPGEGIHGEIDGKNIYIGNRRIAARALCETVPNMEDKRGLTYGYIIIDTEAVGVFTLSDTCRTGAAQALKDLKRLRVKTAMLTGDANEAAMHAQNQLENGIEELHAELLPQDKVRLIEELKKREGPTAMVGDGMNDAPALAMADVGISMGISGSAVAMETSHITLMSNDIRKIPKAIRLAKKTYYKIVVNILFSVITKAVIVVLAVMGHPLIWAAVLADVGTCLIVILNSMMLLHTRTVKNKNFCGSDQKSPTRCAKDANNCKGTRCQSSSSCGLRELKDNHTCHAHEKAVVEITNSKCMNHQSHMETSHLSSCGHDLAEHDKNANQEHLVSVAGLNEQNDTKPGNCTNCCRESVVPCEKTSIHKHSNSINVTKGNHDDVHENVTCSQKSNAKKDCCKNLDALKPTSICKDIDKPKICECCMENQSDCGGEQHCSSSITIMESQTNGCCRNPKKRIREKGGYYADKTEELPV